MRGMTADIGGPKTKYSNFIPYNANVKPSVDERRKDYLVKLDNEDYIKSDPELQARLGIRELYKDVQLKRPALNKNFDRLISPMSQPSQSAKGDAPNTTRNIMIHEGQENIFNRQGTPSSGDDPLNQSSLDSKSKQRTTTRQPKLPKIHQSQDFARTRHNMSHDKSAFLTTRFQAYDRFEHTNRLMKKRKEDADLEM